MAITYKKQFQPVQLGTSIATIFTNDTTPTNVLLRGARIRLTNVTGSAVSAQLNVVPNAGAASATNQITSTNFSVAANGWQDIDLPVMAAGDFLQGLAGTASAISVHFINGGLFS